MVIIWPSGLGDCEIRPAGIVLGQLARRDGRVFDVGKVGTSAGEQRLVGFLEAAKYLHLPLHLDL